MDKKKMFAIHFGTAQVNPAEIKQPFGLAFAFPMLIVLAVLAVAVLAQSPESGLLMGTVPVLSTDITKHVDSVREEIVGKFKEYEETSKKLETKIQEQLTEIESKVGKPNAALAAEIGELKTQLKDREDFLKTLRGEFDEMRAQATAADAPTDEGPGPISARIKEDAKVQSFMQRGYHQGHVMAHLKGIFPQGRMTTITSSAVGSSTAGILVPDRVRDYIPAAQRRFTLRDILPSSPTEGNAVEYPKENAFTNAASPQVEGSAKAESALTFTIETAAVRTIAHWIPASRQVLDDWPQLQRIIDNKMLYGLKLKEEAEILTGDGTGVHLNGLVTQATPFDTARIVTNDNILDFIRHAISQVEEADEGADFVVLNPKQFWLAMGLKDGSDNQGDYIAMSPIGGAMPMSLWGKALVPTNSMTDGSFLVGNSNQAEIFDRMQAAVVISTEHEEYFTKNLVAIRVEERIALAVYRTGSFVTGSLAAASPLG